MPNVDVDGLRMYYEVEGTGTPVIFISGLSGDHLGWAMQVPAVVAAGHRCIVFDNRDAGQTDGGPVAAYSIRRFADDTVGLLSALGVSAAHIVGASMGGMIAQEMAINYPDRVMSVTLVCTVATIDEAISGILRSWKMLRPHASADEFFRVISPWLLTYRFYERPEPMESFLGIVRGNPFPQTPEGFARQCDAILGHDSIARLASIAAPTHVIVGAEDILTPPPHSHALAAQIRGARLTEVPACGHGLFWEKADEFNQAVLGFIGSQRYAPSA